MKNVVTFFIVFLFMMAGCTENRHSTGDLITVDVTKHYPKKDLILQDFMDVEYIPLETTDEFLCQDLVRGLSKNMILIRNYRADGDIFIFDIKTGKGLKKMNRKGQGAEEYLGYNQIALDEDNNEIFISDANTQKIKVYDFDGNFKRSFGHCDSMTFSSVYNFDSGHLICNDYFFDGPFKIISKQDGSVKKEIQIPIEKKLEFFVSFKENNQTYTVNSGSYHAIVPYLDSWILVEPSSDTVYRYSPQSGMRPLMLRTPAIQSMEPEVFLFPNMITDRYYFMDAEKKEFNTSTYEGFPLTHLAYDKEEKAIFEYTLYNDDYTDKKEVEPKRAIPLNGDVTLCIGLDASMLVEDYGKGKLKGRLKEIAATLNEDSNPVIMLIKHKIN